jgi:hypothetical protein
MANEARVGETASRRLGRRATRSPRALRALPATCWDGTLTTPVEITAPDRESAGVLLGEAVPHFRAELVETAGSAVLVRLEPAAAWSAGWVFELLALIERWLEARSLPVAKVRHGHRSYVITASGPWGRWDGAPTPLAAA